MTGSPIRAAAAREVLSDCHAALGELRGEAGGRTRRLRWIAVAALLRTVREALFRADAGLDRRGEPDPSAPVNPHLRAAVLDFKAAMTDKSPQIYWAFILDEANNILHEYRSGIRQAASVVISPDNILSNLAPFELFQVEREGPVDLHYDLLMERGSFKGADAIALAEEAARWWGEQLDQIEANAAQRSHSARAEEG